MLKKLFSVNSNQKGFTLVELLVSIAISGIIGAAIVAITFQIVTVNSANGNRMEAVKQVENALHWINRDAQTAWPSSATPEDGTEINFPLTLEWTDYDEIDYQITYSLDSGTLQRTQQIDSGPETITRIANNIDATSNYTFNGSILTVNMTATVEGFRTASETRTLQVKPRTIK